ncbi:hypothetical protein Pst134EA_009390 [Puccinia striiformis f. sp. tritici]|uniref:hypothetical protein n=1 Tax=Puccinia striiformis f. sp. tritici TaxID=168172 RepID=UPI002007FD7C|nr:hypothetical protein Pst134EA_009390 [Puccinia striiformis f. sp. tritici]KAH9468859.1 hypothetical protein Pst134EA_009390 [Puccinia striiformis f. sp. tritici]
MPELKAHYAWSLRQAPSLLCGTSGSDSLKRKNDNLIDLESRISKRFACHLMNDVSHSSNSIDTRLNSDSAKPSEFLLDHQPSRSNHDNHATEQNKELTLSQSNESSQLSLLKRISLPFEDNSRFV